MAEQVLRPLVEVAFRSLQCSCSCGPPFARRRLATMLGFGLHPLLAPSAAPPLSTSRGVTTRSPHALRQARTSSSSSSSRSRGSPLRRERRRGLRDTHPPVRRERRRGLRDTHPPVGARDERAVTRVHALLPSLLPLATALVDRAATDKVCVLARSCAHCCGALPPPASTRHAAAATRHAPFPRPAQPPQPPQQQPQQQPPQQQQPQQPQQPPQQPPPAASSAAPRPPPRLALRCLESLFREAHPEADAPH